MCGRLNIIDDYGVQQLCEQLRISLWSQQGQKKRFTRATDKVSIVRQVGDHRQLDEATWWLLLEPSDQGFKPSRYTSFNTRYDKLNVPRSAGYVPFRSTRCIIPAKGFGESEFVNKKPLHYHDFEALDGEAIAFGGLYREWLNKQTGEVQLSCSIITLPPHPKLASYHSKSMPLMLPHDLDLWEAWLDPNFKNIEAFQYLLAPNLPQSLWVQKIDKPSLHNPLSEKQLINYD